MNLDSLKTVDVAALPSVFPADADKGRQLAEDRRHVRRTDKAVMLDARRLANAIEHIGTLPSEGQSYHFVTEKKFSMGHVIPATLHLASPAILDYLAVVTLSFSQTNITDLLVMLDSGQVNKVDFAYSCYFRSNNREQCQRLADELGSRPGCRIYSGLIHAKILLMQLSDGTSYVVESSANLRSCSSIEQITLTHDAALLDFHRTWINKLMEARK